MYCPSYFDKHHTGSVSCQLACDVVVGNMDWTGQDTVETVTTWLWWEHGLDGTTDIIDVLTSWSHTIHHT